uniref:Putative targeting complex trapp subunit n=1 Tax=Phlebotomus kandelakii TaxID=1109342 RepID=A0A6B2EIB5_9DIPT
MSHPDYEQNAHHHGALLVLVRGIGPAKPRSLQKVFERIQSVNTVRIVDSAGHPRDIWVRYIRDHPVENNDWGDFQTHRRLLGLVTVGKFDTQTELNELCRIHESLKVKYTSTLYDSRCLLFGPTTAPESVSIPEDDTKSTGSDSGSNKENSAEVNSNGKVSGSPMTSKKLQEIFTPPPNFKSRAFFYPENDGCANLEAAMTEFIGALFWVLESKRLERSREKIDKVSLLLAPFEKRDFVGLDLESRNNRKRCMGRVTKNLADLTLQAGLVAESLTLFHAASETLRAISDSLWLGAANEGLCAASAILLYPHMRQPQPLQRNASLQEAGSPQRRVASKSTKKVTGIVQSNTEADSGVVKSTCSSMSSSSSESSTSSLTSSISPGVTTGSSSSVSSIVAPPGSIEDSPVAPFPPNILSPEDITTRYRDAIINYSKYRHAGIIETEAALKAARICIEQGHNLDVSMFLQNVLYINLNMSEQERVQRFETLTGLYEKIGYHRKASFCQRLAAWRHVAASNANPDWTASYRLMLDSFAGHKMSLDPLEMLTQDSGWKCLQVDLLQQLVLAAKRMDNAAVAVRHLTYTIQTMWPHLSAAEQHEVATHLQNLAAQCEGAPVPLVLDSGRVLPPANLTDLPYCCQLQVRELPIALRPHKIATNKVDSGPFLFTPIHFTSATGGQHRGSAGGGSGSGSASSQPVQWVQNDVGEVALKLKNPLPGDLHVCDMRLLSTGIVFESRPQTISLVASPAATSVTLQGTPLEVGKLEILGYSTHTLGVKSNCRLRDMQRSRQHLPTSANVEVIPALPTLSVTTSLPEKGLTLYNGEEAKVAVTLTNTGSVQIEFLEGAIHSQLDSATQARIFHWVTPEEVNRALPIAPQASVTFTLRIFGDADFLGPVNLSLLSAGAGLSPAQVAHDGPQSLSVGSTSLMTVTSGPSNHSRVSSPTHRRNTELTSSFRSTHSGHSSLATVSLNTATMGTGTRHMEAQLRLRFSGGAGYQEGYCRQVSAALPLELLPSAHITNWDVLPAETPSQFYLVLDVVNVTGQEMALQYTEQKNIVIEAKESCRIPVPVERCPLEKIQSGMAAPSESGSVMSGHEVDHIEKICSGHISDQVNLHWSLAGTETKGLASLKGITLSPAMLDLVTVAPLQWEISVDREKVTSTAEISKMTGECVTLGVSIINLSPQPLHRLIISIQFYQDYQNGMHNYRLETRIIMSGANEILIPFLGRSERASHECSVIFFTPGRFKADIQCSAQNSQMVSISSHAAESTSSGGGVSSVGGNTANTSASLSGRRVSADSHIWRFTPPIEVTVVE